MAVQTGVHEGTGDSLDPASYDYDIVIVGAGSGGMAMAKHIGAIYKKRVCLLDFVQPSPQGTTWGLGGTCVNVGCIPKKLMHHAALLRQGMTDAQSFGYSLKEQPEFAWQECVMAVQNHIKMLNFQYRKTFYGDNIKYCNAYGRLVDRHTVKMTSKSGDESTVTGKYIVVATGGRPRIPDFPGANLCITSDDLFSMSKVPGKTLIIGASYVALECAGFLAGMGFDVTVMVRSILLRGFDQEMAVKIGENMRDYHNIKFVYGYVPESCTSVGEGAAQKIEVSGSPVNDESRAIGAFKDTFDTVMLAVGRDPCTKSIGLEDVGVKLDDKGFVYSDNEATNVWNIYALGDILSGKPELTPTAIQAGRLLADRLFGDSVEPCDYVNVPTTVFTPLEYGCCGLTEDEAREKYGDDNVDVYHDVVSPLEYAIPRGGEQGYAKVVTLRNENDLVVGFHFLGPNAGEVTQGLAVAMKCGLTKAILNQSIGIHPTVAESFTVMPTTKRSGVQLSDSGC